MNLSDPLYKLHPIAAPKVPVAMRLCQAVGNMFSGSHTPETYGYESEPANSNDINNSEAADWINIPVSKASPRHDEQIAFQTKGQFLARQEDWDIFASLITDADQSRAKTANGVPVTELLTYGARADVVLAVEHALFDGRPANKAQLEAGIEALEHVRADHPNSYPVALVVALAHMDVGLAWRGNGWLSVLSAQNKDAFVAHFARALSILDQFEHIEQTTPSLKAARCMLLAKGPTPQSRVADQFETLIDLDPTNAGYMRTLGTHLVRQAHGTSASIELEARRTAARTQNIWGAGAYTWVYLDAILIDDTACAHLDTSFFIEGMRDILTRSPDQHTANLLAAYCSVSMHAGCGSDDAADLVRCELMKCASWIIRDHLAEIHPLIWARASGRFDRSAQSQSIHKLADRGHRDALDAISDMVGDHIHIAQ